MPARRRLPTALPPARLTLACLVVSSALAACGGSSDAGRADAIRHPLDDVLRVNHIQMEGSHNSYHLRPENPLFDAIAPVTGWAYDMPTLTEQLDRDGVRQLELDVHWVASEGTFRVHHIPVADPRSTCPYLADCLAELRAWSLAHPGHHPIVVAIEPKSDVDLHSPLDGHVAEIDAALVQGLGEELLVRPDEVRGSYGTLAEALAADGWPTLAATRGRFLFVLLDQDQYRAEYLADAPRLEGRVMFTMAEPGDPNAAFTAADGAEEVRARAEEGCILRELSAGAGTPPAEGAREIAEDVVLGYHAISTDFPSALVTPELYLQLDGGTPSRCNPLVAPPECTAEAIEDPKRLR